MTHPNEAGRVLSDAEIEAIARAVQPISRTGLPSWEHAVARDVEQAILAKQAAHSNAYRPLLPARIADLMRKIVLEGWQDAEGMPLADDALAALSLQAAQSAASTGAGGRAAREVLEILRDIDQHIEQGRLSEAKMVEEHPSHGTGVYTHIWRQVKRLRALAAPTAALSSPAVAPALPTPAAPTAPASGAVATAHLLTDQNFGTTRVEIEQHADIPDGAALYLGPPSAPASLTDERINELRQKHGITSDGRGIKEWAKVRDFAHELLAAVEQAEPSGDRMAYEGAREDLLEWKRRALEAEAQVRNFVREVNGQTFMGELGVEAGVPINGQTVSRFLVTIPAHGRVTCAQVKEAIEAAQIAARVKVCLAGKEASPSTAEPVVIESVTSEPHPNAFMQVPAGTKIKATFAAAPAVPGEAKPWPWMDCDACGGTGVAYGDGGGSRLVCKDCSGAGRVHTPSMPAPAEGAEQAVARTFERCAQVCDWHAARRPLEGRAAREAAQAIRAPASAAPTAHEGDEALMRQALEAMDNAVYWRETGQGRPPEQTCMDAIAALRQRLAGNTGSQQ